MPLTPDLMFAPEPTLPAAGRLLLVTEADEADQSRAAAGRLELPVRAVAHERLLTPHADGVAVTARPAAVIPLLAGAGALARLARGHRPRGWPVWRPLPASVTAWAQIADLALGLVARGQIAPTLHRDGHGTVRAAWTALLDADPGTEGRLERAALGLPPAGRAVPHPAGSAEAPRLHTATALARGLVDALADAAARDAAALPDSGRPRARLLPWTQRWREALADPEDPTVPLREDEADELVAGVASWHGPSAHARLRLALEAPDDPEEPWWLAFGLRTDAGEAVSADAVWARADDGTDPDAAAHADALLTGLGRVGRVFPPLDNALAEPTPSGCRLDRDDAWRLIDEVAPLLEATDVELDLPDTLVEGPRLRVRLGDAGAEGDGELTVDDVLDADGAVGTTIEVAIDGETLDHDELDALLATDAPLVAWRGRWVRLDPDLRQRLAELPATRSVAIDEAMRWALAGTVPAGLVAPEAEGAGALTVDVVPSGGVAGLLDRLEAARHDPAMVARALGGGRNGAQAEHGQGAEGDAGEAGDADGVPDGFCGALRPYQERGVSWLGAMGLLGFGAVLADDMGLGKTIQLIGHLLARGGHGPFLVVCPTSVVGNWVRELERFAPDLPVTRFHGPERARDLEGVHGVVVTSYGTLRRDADPLTAVSWDVITLDEAQHVKNPSTAGARAVRRLSARQTIALTGTPLENRLTELWTLLDTTNPGLLGSRTRFGQQYVAPVERRGDAEAAERLRRLVAPFVLRRRKDDPEVIADLPDKIEREVHVGLTAEQAGRYQEAVDRVIGGNGLAQASTMERRGRVLALLTELKQICNHPAHHDDDPQGALEGRSGKLAVARDLVADAVDAGERVLVFTQFVAMGRLLVRQLGADLGVDVPMLHGGVSATARDRMVAGFQSADGSGPPVLVVSLRAGGTGLNLTAATQVIHYDRWWNPAVEDQATDRAHRIGQTRRVAVHKLVTAGTVEERVANLLERKRDLADRVVGEGEAWLTELDDDTLADLVRLSAPHEPVDDEAIPLEEAG